MRPRLIAHIKFTFAPSHAIRQIEIDSKRIWRVCVRALFNFFVCRRGEVDGAESLSLGCIKPSANVCPLPPTSIMPRAPCGPLDPKHKYPSHTYPQKFISMLILALCCHHSGLTLQPQNQVNRLIKIGTNIKGRKKSHRNGRRENCGTDSVQC